MTAYANPGGLFNDSHQWGNDTSNYRHGIKGAYDYLQEHGTATNDELYEQFCSSVRFSRSWWEQRGVDTLLEFPGVTFHGWRVDVEAFDMDAAKEHLPDEQEHEQVRDAHRRKAARGMYRYLHTRTTEATKWYDLTGVDATEWQVIHRGQRMANVQISNPEASLDFVREFPGVVVPETEQFEYHS